ncbi:membrane protein [Lysinibacillus sp. BF-4]|uniref:DUF1405 domain-containing protein n=1 Tax=Lysinibacillus sp. BF-4 TaxID=1473546 RepID=UPI0005002591|nr:DUF1405 domain-containing protein [Lysinibacillus sp. BF-4]KFL44515.1 membrane protein [Lysinibacillus sp. BF-4]
MQLLAQLKYIVTSRKFLWLLLVINALGTIYGYYWYGAQLAITRPIFYIFVPDSPTASLFFCFVLIAWLMGKQWRLMEALALITLVKYGVWAVDMNLLMLTEIGELGFDGWMLVFSHGAMAVQAIVYLAYYSFTYWHVAVAGIWTLHNDVIDYVFGQMPMYGPLTRYMPYIGYVTFWLSIGCIGIAIYCIKKRGLVAETIPSK